MKIDVEINVVVEVTATLDTETNEITFSSADVSCYDSEWHDVTDSGWLDADQVREHFGERVLMDADAFVARQLYRGEA
jgi:hypothetical protein